VGHIRDSPVQARCGEVMTAIRTCFATVVLILAASVAAEAGDDVELVGIETWGNYHAGGVVVEISGDDNSDATVACEVRTAGQGSFSAALAPVRIDATHLVTSLFGLTPAGSYEVRVTIQDPDGVTGSATETVSLVTRSDTFPEPSLRRLYVAPGGDDGGPGTDPNHPLETVQRAADLAQAGDLVLIAPGDYHEGVWVPRSGTAGQPIVFRGSAPGAVLEGADEAIADGVTWTDQGSGVHSLEIDFGTGHVVTDQGRLYRYATVSELQALGAGSPGGFVIDGSTLSVKMADGSTSADRTMWVAKEENGFYLDGRSHVRIENLELRHYGAGDYGKGVYLRYSNDCAVRFCRIHEVGSAGVWIKGGERHLIEGNEIWDTSIFGWPWPYTKGSNAENNAVALTNDVGRGVVIRRNWVWGTFNGIGPCGGSAPAGVVTTETDVYENVFSEHTDDALEPEGYCSNVRLWGNTIRDSHMAFAVAPAAPGPTYILRNVAYDVGNTRTSAIDGYMASALKINSGYPTPIGPLFLFHNTFLTTAPNTDAVALLNPGQSTYIMARNNIIAGTRYGLYKVNPVELDWDFDDLHTTDPTRLVSWHGTKYPTLAAFQGATGQEPDGISVAPALVDPVNGVFRPESSSPVVDGGEVIPGVNDGFEGAAPDIGAIEYTRTIFADGFETGNDAAWRHTVQ